MTYSEDDLRAFMLHSPSATAYLSKRGRVLAKKQIREAITLAVGDPNFPIDYRKILLDYQREMDMDTLKPHTILFTEREAELIRSRMGSKTFHKYVHDKALEE